MSTLYACPVCTLPLVKVEKRLCCNNNHNFDIHKKGYVNLLLAQFKRSKSPGDDIQMIQSRQRFLRAGHYDQLANYISCGLNNHIETNGNLLDAGCGEGHYLDYISKENPSLSCYGLDISKPAIYAASQNKSNYWCVASSAKPPFLENSFDAIISVFSHVDSEAFFGILKPNSFVCMVTPDQDHLLALRKLVYDEVRPYNIDKHQHYFDNRFDLIKQHKLNVSIHLTSSQEILDLLGMTPHAHRLSVSSKKQIAAIETLQDNACFRIYWYRVVK